MRKLIHEKKGNSRVPKRRQDGRINRSVLSQLPSKRQGDRWMKCVFELRKFRNSKIKKEANHIALCLSYTYGIECNSYVVTLLTLFQ